MFCSHTVSAQEDDIILVRTEPDPTSQELPCANQIIVYECRLLIPTFTLTWILPNGEELEFNSDNDIIENNTVSNGTTIATLTEMMPAGGGRFLFSSTLLIQETIDMSSLTCVGATLESDNPTAETTIIHSG